MQTQVAYALDSCLLCRSSKLELVLPLEPIPIATPNFVVPAGMEDSRELRDGVPLNLNQCADCGHVQVSHYGNPELQYRDYAYTTATSLGLRDHFARYTADVLDYVRPPRGARVVDVGSNDGTLLRLFQERGMTVLGVEPGRAIAEHATTTGIPTVADFLTEKLGRRLREQQGPAAIVTANNVIANVPDLFDFGAAIEAILADDGVFVFETQYGVDVIERNLLDTIYHEHLSYFLVRPTRAFLERVGLELIDVQRNASKGGAIRVFAQKSGGSRPVTPAVGTRIAEEENKGAFGREYYAKLTSDLAAIREQLLDLVAAEKSQGRRVAGYGVSVGTTTLLPQFGLTGQIDFLVDDLPRDPVLAGPGYSIPVYSPDAVAAQNPGLIVIFAWRYSEPIMKKHRAYLERGGRFVVPLPKVVVY